MKISTLKFITFCLQGIIQFKENMEKEESKANQKLLPEETGIAEKTQQTKITDLNDYWFGANFQIFGFI